MKKSERQGLRTWVEISKKAIHANYRAFRSLVPKNVKILSVVKSNAYGHDIFQFAQELELCGVDMLAVDSLVEALALRKNKIKTPILVLGYTLPEMYEKAVKKNIHITISSMSGLKNFLKTPYAYKIPIHIKVDTGMHRQGFMFSEKASVLKLLKAHHEKIIFAGLYTHFASAKDPNDIEFTKKQISEFTSWVDDVHKNNFAPIVHAGATGGVLAFNESHFDMVRVGIGMYGVYPSDAIETHLKEKLKLQPILTWKTIISEIKEVSEGEGVGYDLTHELSKKTKVAVCPVGYWHGYIRLLSNNGHVLVNGGVAPVLGRVSMDMITIDVSDIKNVKAGDEVVLIGTSEGREITAGELAQRASTTAYEVLTRLNPLMRRFYR